MARTKKAVETAKTSVIVTSIKGFDKDLKCRGYQFEIGATYHHDGKVKACESGFHACPVEHHPLSVFEFYVPAGNRFFEVSQFGETSAEGTKLASASITINVELTIPVLIKWAWDYVWSRCKIEGEVATGYQGAASATGYRGAASATGNRGAASATGYQGAASATGNQGAAMASGYEGRVMGKNGSALFAVERDWDSSGNGDDARIPVAHRLRCRWNRRQGSYQGQYLVRLQRRRIGGGLMTPTYAITPAQLRASAENVRDPALAMRMLDRADAMEANERRDALRFAYERTVMTDGIMSRPADLAWRELNKETHRQLGARS